MASLGAMSVGRLRFGLLGCWRGGVLGVGLFEGDGVAERLELLLEAAGAVFG